MKHLIVLALLVSSISMATNWSFVIDSDDSVISPSSGNVCATIGCTGGSWEATENSSGKTMAGTFDRVSQGFIKFLIVTEDGSCGGSCPALESTINSNRYFWGTQTKGFFTAIEPLLTTETQLILNVYGPTCPGSNEQYNWVWNHWTGTANDPSVNSQSIAGWVSWNDAASQMTVENIWEATSWGNVSWYGTPGALVLSDSDVSGCSAGAITLGDSNSGDTKGTLYTGSGGSMLWVTDANHTAVGTNKRSAMTAADLENLYGTYTGFRYTSSGSDTAASGIKKIEMTIYSDCTPASDTNCTGKWFTDIEAETFDATTETMQNISINSPANSMITATIDNGTGTGKVTCLVNLDEATNGQNSLFCAGQTPNSATNPYNILLFSKKDSPGATDLTWGVNTGATVMTTAYGYADVFGDLGVQSDGKIVALGSGDYQTGTYDYKAQLARLLENGTADTAFDPNGDTTTAYLETVDLLSGKLQGNFNAMAIQADDKLVIVGTVLNGNGPKASNPDFIVHRLLPDGGFDSSFNGGAAVTFEGNIPAGSEVPYDVGVQSTGTIVAVGDDNYAATLWTVNADGTHTTTRDSNVGTNLYGLAIDSSDNIFAIGAGGEQMAIVKYDSSGALDTSFGDGGDGHTRILFHTENLIDPPTKSFGKGIAIQSDGLIVVVGVTPRVAGVESDQDLAVARFDTNGALDSSFNSDGRFTWDNGDVLDQSASDVIIQPDGKILVFGSYYDTVADNQAVAVLRLLNDGTLDPSFGNAGVVKLLIGSVCTAFSSSATRPAVRGILDSVGNVLAGTTCTTTNGFFTIFKIWR